MLSNNVCDIFQGFLPPRQLKQPKQDVTEGPRVELPRPAQPKQTPLFSLHQPTPDLYSTYREQSQCSADNTTRSKGNILQRLKLNTTATGNGRCSEPAGMENLQSSGRINNVKKSVIGDTEVNMERRKEQSGIPERASSNQFSNQLGCMDSPTSLDTSSRHKSPQPQLVSGDEKETENDDREMLPVLQGVLKYISSNQPSPWSMVGRTLQPKNQSEGSQNSHLQDMCDTVGNGNKHGLYDEDSNRRSCNTPHIEEPVVKRSATQILALLGVRKNNPVPEKPHVYNIPKSKKEGNSNEEVSETSVKNVVQTVNEGKTMAGEHEKSRLHPGKHDSTARDDDLGRISEGSHVPSAIDRLECTRKAPGRGELQHPFVLQGEDIDEDNGHSGKILNPTFSAVLKEDPVDNVDFNIEGKDDGLGRVHEDILPVKETANLLLEANERTTEVCGEVLQGGDHFVGHSWSQDVTQPESRPEADITIQKKDELTAKDERLDLRREENEGLNSEHQMYDTDEVPVNVNCPHSTKEKTYISQNHENMRVSTTLDVSQDRKNKEGSNANNIGQDQKSIEGSTTHYSGQDCKHMEGCIPDDAIPSDPEIVEDEACFDINFSPLSDVSESDTDGTPDVHSGNKTSNDSSQRITRTLIQDIGEVYEDELRDNSCKSETVTGATIKKNELEGNDIDVARLSSKISRKEAMVSDCDTTKSSADILPQNLQHVDETNVNKCDADSMDHPVDESESPKDAETLGLRLNAMSERVPSSCSPSQSTQSAGITEVKTYMGLPMLSEDNYSPLLQNTNANQAVDERGSVSTMEIPSQTTLSSCTNSLGESEAQETFLSDLRNNSHSKSTGTSFPSKENNTYKFSGDSQIIEHTGYYGEVGWVGAETPHSQRSENQYDTNTPSEENSQTEPNSHLESSSSNTFSDDTFASCDTFGTSQDSLRLNSFIPSPKPHGGVEGSKYGRINEQDQKEPKQSGTEVIPTSNKGRGSSNLSGTTIYSGNWTTEQSSQHKPPLDTAGHLQNYAREEMENPPIENNLYLPDRRPFPSNRRAVEHIMKSLHRRPSDTYKMETSNIFHGSSNGMKISTDGSAKGLEFSSISESDEFSIPLHCSTGVSEQRHPSVPFRGDSLPLRAGRPPRGSATVPVTPAMLASALNSRLPHPSQLRGSNTNKSTNHSVAKLKSESADIAYNVSNITTTSALLIVYS